MPINSFDPPGKMTSRINSNKKTKYQVQEVDFVKHFI